MVHRPLEPGTQAALQSQRLTHHNLVSMMETFDDGTLRSREFDEPDRPSCVNIAPTSNRKRGDWSPQLPDDRGQPVSSATGSSMIQSVTGSSTLQSVSACSGEKKYETEAISHGLCHDSSLDDCRCNTLVKKLQDGVFDSELLAFLASVFETPAAVAIPGAAVLLLKTNRSGIKDTNQDHEATVRKYITGIDQPLLLGDRSGAYTQ